MESPRPEVLVRCAGVTYLGALISTRAEWTTERNTVMVSILVQTLDGTLHRFYFETADSEAWGHLERNPPRVIEASAMKREGA